MAAPDYWQVLGLSPGADAAALKRAFRAQARRWHPDLNGNDPVAEERFKLVNEAYAVLSDPRRRHSWEAGEPEQGSEPDPFASGFPGFSTYIDEIFGASRAAEEREDPPADDGPAAAEPSPARPRGDVAPREATPPPVVAAEGAESVVELSPDQALHGERLELELPDGSVVEVWTPPLAGDGWRLRLAGLGPGGGDHFLQLRVRTDEGLRIDGLRVLHQLDLTPAEAVLGCQVVVPTLGGPVRLRVPAGSSSGRLLRLRGRGQAWGERRGDQLVEVRIAVPDQPDEAEQALYRRLLELEREREAGGPQDR
jgi:DnaJ-class molecular chaperone